ncbi:response regulator [Metasolibacillus fluoroglycofenilyticus]|uniref:response regulator n=1 Tax=Metasolibacillus fluoroglycofenilyticus TaxID=1239396 RepID=UPI000D3C93AC|nr:response regulator [Metasolibacillus fluoroglycofenilyticus]
MPTVMVVDDALFMRSFISNLFENWGFTVVAQAANGKKAIALFQELQPDLVTMDLTMPIMTGLEASKHIIEEFPEARIIMITALGQQRHVKEALMYGVKDFVVKPFKPEELKQIVDTLFENKS